MWVLVDVVLRDTSAVSSNVRGDGGGGGTHLSIDGVGRRDDATPRVQAGVYARLGDRDGLLFHDFVYRNTIDVRHLVELVDTHDTAVGEHHGTSLESTLARIPICGDRGSQTDARTSTTGGRDRERRSAEDETKELRFRCGWIAYHEYVDISTDVCTVLQVLLCAAEKQKKDGLLDLVVPIYRGCERLRQERKDVSSFGELIDLTDVDIGEGSLCDATANL